MEYQVMARNLPQDPFLRAYLEAAEWAGITEDGETEGEPGPREQLELSVHPEWDPKCLQKAAEDCEAFRQANASDLEDMNPGQAGHDFYLTRNRHGAGFWDRGLGALGQRLTDAAHTFGETYESFDAETETLYTE